MSSRGPRRLLLSIFITWKALLALILLSSPGPGYDTSTSLLENASMSIALGETPNTMHSPLWKLVRWDAIYFTQISSRGHVYEQEWAFGLGFSKIVSLLLSVMQPFSLSDRLGTSIIIGVTVSHLAHWLSVLALYELAKTVQDRGGGLDRRVPFLAAALHVISPAGVFLSAPCSEGLFSCLSMLGFLVYCAGMIELEQTESIAGRSRIICAGLLFGCATMVRSNGLLSGLPFLYDAGLTALALFRGSNRPGLLSKLFSLIVGGLLIAIGFVLPQYYGYQLYCAQLSDHERRPWCDQRVPGMYGWVQGHYWNNGLFRYWTLSNLPLFLLAAPALWIMSSSAIKTLIMSKAAILFELKASDGKTDLTIPDQSLIRLALPQLVMTVLAFTRHHVQIITRLASGYPLWYITIASGLIHALRTKSASGITLTSKVSIRFMIIYAVIQCGLYASFLPPA